jgi:large subunit ribosomal protein L32
MARPKRRTSKRRKAMRNSHAAVALPNVILCPNCQEPTLSHRVCKHCGYYKGKEVIAQEED